MEESKNAYLAARKLGRKYLADRSEWDGYLTVLDELLKRTVIVGEVKIGTHEIPLNLLAGTKTAGRSSAFAGNFMPLLEPNTEFAAKWRKVYESQIEEGIREPILVFQYLNKYYVQEGNKRVSILNAVGAASAYAQIYRLIPERDDASDEISIYYEFLDFDKRLYFGDLWFSKRGFFTRLAELAAAFAELNEGSPGAATEGSDAITTEISTGAVIFEVYRLFKAVYLASGLEAQVNLTPGDALVEYCEVFGLPAKLEDGVIKVDSAAIRHNLTNFKTQLLVAAGEVERRVENVDTDIDVEADKSLHRGLFSRVPAKLTIAIAYDATPETSLWTAMHDLAIRRIERKYGDRLTVRRIMNIPTVGELAYRTLNQAAQDKPQMLFTTSPSMSTVSLRYALEHPETVVLNCDVPHEGKSLHTYFCKMYDLTFLCGILAGAMSETGVAGYMTSAQTWSISPTYDINAFALGARLINPRFRVLDYAMRKVNDWQEHEQAKGAFASGGADIAFCRHSPDNPLDRKAFPEVYAQIYRLASNGASLDSLAAATLDWEPFYDKFIGDALQGRASLASGTKGGDPVHFGWGFQTGIMDIFPVYSVVGVAGRLLRIFRDQLKSGALHPFEGPIRDNHGVMRVADGEVPALMQIQEMDWLTYSIEQLN
jgi:hypothetical protein